MSSNPEKAAHPGKLCCCYCFRAVSLPANFRWPEILICGHEDCKKQFLPLSVPDQEK